MKKTILMVSTSRADWVSLGAVAREIIKRNAVQLRVIGAGPHQKEAEEDIGVSHWWLDTSDVPPVSADTILMMAVDSDIGVNQPDLIILLGDRHETLTAAQVAVMRGVPILHIAGGDFTPGSADDRYRNAISMLATYHCVTHAEASHRLRSMGIDPQAIHITGSPAVSRITSEDLYPADAVRATYAVPPGDEMILVNWQPDGDNEGLATIIAALDVHPEPATIFVVGPNNDHGRDQVVKMEGEWAGRNPKVRIIPHMPWRAYLSLMACADVLVGNSSSIFYEAPVIGVPSVNVGNRQMSRLSHWPACVASVGAADDLMMGPTIAERISHVRFSPEFPFGGHEAAGLIADVAEMAAVKPDYEWTP